MPDGLPGRPLAGCGCAFASYASALTGSVIAGISVRNPG